MDLGKKKKLAMRTFGVGKERIIFVKSRLDEIKEAITKQDIRDLKTAGAIILKNVKGRRLKPKKHKRKSQGNIRTNVNTRKRDYIILTRKLRKYLSELKSQGEINNQTFKELRKKIRNREFKSKANLKLYMEEMLK